MSHSTCDQCSRIFICRRRAILHTFENNIRISRGFVQIRKVHFISATSTLPEHGPLTVILFGNANIRVVELI